MRHLRHYLNTIPTPVIDSHGVLLKAEYSLPSGSHKDRETVHLLQQTPRHHHLVVTTGNAGISLAYYLGRKAHIVVPEVCDTSKIELMRSYGADVMVLGSSYNDSWKIGLALASAHSWRNISPGVEPMRSDGDATIAQELSFLKPDVVYVPSANHTLAYGIARALPSAQIVSCVLPNHPFLNVMLQPARISGYKSINTGMGPYLERRFLTLPNTRVKTVSQITLDITTKQYQNDHIDLAVALAIEIALRENVKGKSVVIGTGIRR